MKSKNKERLKEDFVKYCDQIGIVQRPRLILDRKEMHTILVDNGKVKRAAGHGQCLWDLDILFVDTGKRNLRNKTYPWRGRYVRNNKKMTLRELRHVLVHELVHYRFRYLNHGVKFEKRISEILKGRTFAPKSQKK